MPIYEFSCDTEKQGCGEVTTIHCSYDDLPKKPKCEHCDKDDLRRLYGVGMIKSSYEKNGRKAMRVRTGDGKPVERSMTRQNHLDGKGTKSVYTKEYQNRIDKSAAEGAAKANYEAKKRLGGS
jgi:hypothetical protein